MLRFLIEVVVPALVVGWGAWYTVAYHTLKRRVAGLNEPALWLSRSERRKRARELLRMQDDQRIQEMIERQTNYLKGNPTNEK